MLSIFACSINVAVMSQERVPVMSNESKSSCVKVYFLPKFVVFLMCVALKTLK